tara:strand:- start:1231 stop:2106 length:876 start_codon:yes stop_codon:yes gene_type:complete
MSRALPDALAEWKDYAEKELTQLHRFRKQQLLDWWLVKGAINCAVVSCPVAALRAEIRALRDNGVYGSSMVPYLQCLRGILDTVDAHADDVDENTLEEFSESEDEEEEEEEDDEDDDAAEDSYDSEGGEEAYDSENDAYDSEAEAECGDDADADAGGGAKKQGLRVVEGMVASPPPAAAAAAAAARAQSHSRPKPTAVPVRLKKPSKGGSKSSKGASERSEYQIEKRARYNLFARFLGSYFASERVEKAGVAELLNHPDAAGFGDDEVVSFLDMMTRENKVMLDEGTVWII